MKLILTLLITLALLQSCNNSGESGVVNDGDSAGRVRNNTINPPANPATDTAAGEHRVDIQQRSTDTL